MSFENRDYYREDRGGFGGGGGGGFQSRVRMGSVTMYLLVAIAVVFLIDSVFHGAMRAGGFTLGKWGALTLEEGVYGYQIWRFVTFQFFHGGFLHILFNAIGLYFFGPLLEQWWGSRRFLAFYLLCGVIAGVLYALLAMFAPGVLFPPEVIQSGAYRGVSLVGASGGLFGILAGAAVLFPHMKVMLLIPPIPMTLRTMALIFLGLAFMTVVLGGNNSGGQAAHLGGALMGFILVKKPSWLNWADRLSSPGQASASMRDKFEQAKHDREQRRRREQQQEVDRILDKVRDKGLQSLSESEKKVLQRETDRQRGS